MLGDECADIWLSFSAMGRRAMNGLHEGDLLATPIQKHCATWISKSAYFCLSPFNLWYLKLVVICPSARVINPSLESVGFCPSWEYSPGKPVWGCMKSGTGSTWVLNYLRDEITMLIWETLTKSMPCRFMIWKLDIWVCKQVKRQLEWWSILLNNILTNRHTHL